MAKSVQTKLVLILVLLTVSTMLIVGAVMVNRVGVFYDNDFEKQMEAFFDDDRIAELTQAAAGENGADELYEICLLYTSRCV